MTGARRLAGLTWATIVGLGAVFASSGCHNKTETLDVEVAPVYSSLRDRVFSSSCAFSSCHGIGGPAAHLDLISAGACDRVVNASSCLFSERKLVVPGIPEESFLLAKVVGQDLGGLPSGSCSGSGNAPMPFGGRPLSDEKQKALREWIANGAACEDGVAHDDGGVASADASTPAVIDSLVMLSTSAIEAGQETDLRITLAEAAGKYGQVVQLSISDPSALAIPGSVFVSPGQTSTVFSVIAKRPSAGVAITARIGDSVGASPATVTVSVTGLYLAEIVNRPTTGSANGLQWIKLRNNSAVAIDLSAYSLGAGAGGATETRLPLKGILSPAGCAIVGGPLANESNGAPTYTQATDFDPDLPQALAPGTSAQFALFDVAAAELTDTIANTIANTAEPLDVVVIGDRQADAVPEPPAGASLLRSDRTHWVTSPTPQPTTCSAVANAPSQ